MNENIFLEELEKISISQGLAWKALAKRLKQAPASRFSPHRLAFSAGRALTGKASKAKNWRSGKSSVMNRKILSIHKSLRGAKGDHTKTMSDVISRAKSIYKG